MTDQENFILNLENQFPALSGVAFMQASKQALASGHGVLQTDQGIIYEYFPDGTRRPVKVIEQSIPVTIGQKINLW